MKCRFLTTALNSVLVLAFAATGWATGVDDSVIEAAAAKYRQLFDGARASGTGPGMADTGDFVDEVLKPIELDQLTLDQVQKVLESVPVANSTRSRVKLDDLLKARSAGDDVDAARAALLRLRLIYPTTKSDQKLVRLQETLSHPALGPAVKAGHGAEVFSVAGSLSPSDLEQAIEPMLRMTDSITADSPPALFQYGSRFIMQAASGEAPDAAKSVAPLRKALASAAESKLQSDISERERKLLNDVLGRLNGAWARGELIGHPAPPIQIDWFLDPADPDRKIASLDDLKGKVVVLDFWATWCGPCIASFPKVKALHNHYRGYDVVVLGVTSPQGYHVADGKRIDTTGDPQKEFELMRSFMDEKQMTWPVAFSKQPVFNPDYGVMGIPSMVIIDASGVVRYAGLHPGSELDAKTKLIDPLLGEAGSVIPARMLMPRKPE